MNVKPYLIKILIILSGSVNAQENPKIINNPSAKINPGLTEATKLTSDEKKAMIDRAANVYRDYRTQVEASPFIKKIPYNFIEKSFISKDAKVIERIIPKTRVKDTITPIRYFEWLYYVYKKDYDNTSIIKLSEIIDILKPSLVMIDREGDYFVLFEFIQEMDNRKNGIKQDANETQQRMRIKLVFKDDARTPMIEFIEAINTHYINY